MNVAIPKQNNAVAPCFEVAKLFEIVNIKDGKILSSKIVKCHGSEGFQRVRLLRLHEIHTLICSGIKQFYLDQLLTIGIVVIPDVNDSIDGAIAGFLTGKFNSYKNTQDKTKSDKIVSHDELITWARDLFEEQGYAVSPCTNHDASLIDLVATIQCPVCHEKINVAICCGAQIYRVDQEIKEFHNNAQTRFDARVYVYLTDPQIIKSCDEYGINFVSPEMTFHETRNANNPIIPILQKPIERHEKAFNFKGTSKIK